MEHGQHRAGLDAVETWSRYAIVLEKEELLAIAVQYGHVELVQHLIEMPTSM